MAYYYLYYTYLFSPKSGWLSAMVPTETLREGSLDLLRLLSSLGFPWLKKSRTLAFSSSGPRGQFYSNVSHHGKISQGTNEEEVDKWWRNNI